MPFFVVFYGAAADHPLHPPYHEPGIGSRDCTWVFAPPLGAPPPDGGDYTGFTVSGAQFAGREAAEAAVAAANAQLEEPAPYTIVEAPDEAAVIERVSLRRWHRVLSIHDEAFLGPARAARARNGELLLSMWHPYANPQFPTWFMVHTEDELGQALAKGQRLFWFEVFLEPQLPRRGVVDEQFEQRVQTLLQEACYVPRTFPDGSVRMEENDCLLLAAFQPGSIELETAHLSEPSGVTDWLRAHWGRFVAVGPTPVDWNAPWRSPVT